MDCFKVTGKAVKSFDGSYQLIDRKNRIIRDCPCPGCRLSRAISIRKHIEREAAYLRP